MYRRKYFSFTLIYSSSARAGSHILLSLCLRHAENVGVQHNKHWVDLGHRRFPPKIQLQLHPWWDARGQRPCSTVVVCCRVGRVPRVSMHLYTTPAVSVEGSRGSGAGEVLLEGSCLHQWFREGKLLQLCSRSVEKITTHSKDIQDAGHPVVVDVSPIDCRGVFCYHLH